MNYQKERNNFNALTAKEQWFFAIHNKEQIKIELDNDDTYFTFINDKSEEPVVFTFDCYLGSSEGAFHLLEALGFNVEFV